MTDTITLTIDGREVSVPAGSTIIQACKELDIEIPHFCYHERLSVAGNCRMCLVEVEGGPPKPVASCAWPVTEGMVVKTRSDMAVEARKGTMEFLLINHPLDCPICDQGGECDLQDMAVGYGSDRSRFCEDKRAVEDKDIGPLIKTVMTRCIHCTRCVRFATEVAGVEEFGGTGRGENMKIGTYVERALESELSGNMIDLCPVGALTSKPYAFTARPWELVRVPSIDAMDAVGSHILIDSRDDEVMRIVPKECDHINEEWIADTARFSYDGLGRNRLVSPRVGGKNITWPEAFEAIKKVFKKSKSSAIAGLIGDMHCAEDVYSFGQFMTETLGTPHIGAQSLSSQYAGLSRCATTMSCSLASLEEADAVLLVGCDPRFEAPLINARLRKNVLKRGIPVAHIGPEVDLTYGCQELGASPAVLTELIDGTSSFAKVLKKAKTPLILIGAKAVMGRKDALHVLHLCREISEQYGCVTQDWNGYGMVHQQAGHVAILDVLPAQKRDEVVKSLQAGKIDLLFVYGEGGMDVSLMKKAKCSVFMGTHDGPLAKQADICLPCAAYTEKDGWWVNTEGRVQEGRHAVPPPESAKEDWKIFRALSEKLKEKLPFDSQRQLREYLLEIAPKAYHAVPECVPSVWQPFGQNGAILDEPFDIPVQSFYLNNEVLRASRVMQECHAQAEASKAAHMMKKAS